MDEQSSGENRPETAKVFCIERVISSCMIRSEEEMTRSPSPAAPCIHPPRESAGRQKRNARTGLGAAVLGGEPASLRAGERVRAGVGRRFELGRIM